MTHALDKWFASYLCQVLRRRVGRREQGPLRLYVALADHFEPFRGSRDLEAARRRLRPWEEHLPRLCSELADAAGRPPQHTFFYPQDEYHPEILDRLAALCERGVGEVEIHLHHEGESSAELEDKLASFAELLHRRHGLLRRDPLSGQVVYGFVHGNWALDNSLPGGRHCGVNDELRILARTGCYADFTLPSAPSPAQTRTINSIYYASDDPDRPKSHDRGRPVRRGGEPWGDLLLVQGVLALNWRRRKAGWLPRLENSDLGAHRPPWPERLPLWLRYAPRVEGVEGVRFLKLSCHGAPRRHFEVLLGRTARRFYRRLLRGGFGDTPVEVRFVTCWEMVQVIHALERGEDAP